MIKDLKSRALHRSKILEGQMRGIYRMIENEEYCMDILTQSLAIQRSVSSLNKLIVENHIRTHIASKFKDDNKNDLNTIDELLKLYEIDRVRGK